MMMTEIRILTKFMSSNRNFSSRGKVFPQNGRSGTSGLNEFGLGLGKYPENAGCVRKLWVSSETGS